jgi:hypothetical protein
LGILEKTQILIAKIVVFYIRILVTTRKGRINIRIEEDRGQGYGRWLTSLRVSNLCIPRKFRVRLLLDDIAEKILKELVLLMGFGNDGFTVRRRECRGISVSTVGRQRQLFEGSQVVKASGETHPDGVTATFTI